MSDACLFSYLNPAHLNNGDEDVYFCAFTCSIHAMPGGTSDTIYNMAKNVQKLHVGYSCVEDGWPDTRKHTVLLHALGTEGQRLFYTLPNTGEIRLLLLFLP
ncbi:hypothetical protein AMECASPLE_016848 [Ameca splendens]|uniref:Uncharacterized protein n=1 Tax=Ameca splendens TaxID=208324 RepID=A0ABV0YDP0_9TELE